MTLPAILDALATPARRTILENLCKAPCSAGDLARRAGISPSAASQHLKQLMQARLVEASRDGKQRIYHCLPTGLDSLRDYVAGLQGALGAAPPVANPEPGAAGPGPAPADDPADAIDRAAAGYGRAWSGHDPAVYAIAIRLLLLAAHVQRGLRSTAARLDLQAGELMVLDTLLREGPPYACTPTQLKQRMAITFAGLTRRIDRLQSQGLVDRLVDPNDGRSTLVRLTATAHKRLEAIMREQHYGTDHKALMHMRGTQRALLSAMLKQLLGTMDKMDQEPAGPVVATKID